MNTVPDSTPALLRRYQAYLASPISPEASRPRAGKSTRRAISQSLSAWQSTRGVWEQFLATPLDHIWAWSDLHLGHDNIISYASRPMRDKDEMNHRLLEAAQVVPKDDFLVFGGDVYLGPLAPIIPWMEACPGRKLLVVGNHDKNLTDGRWQDLGFEAATPCLLHELASPLDSPVTPIQVSSLYWTHYPLVDVSLPAGVVNIHGHIHDRWQSGPYINLSVERQGYSPRRLSDILAKPQV